MASQQNHIGLRLKSPEDLLRRDRLPSFRTRDLTLGGGNTQRSQGTIGSASDSSTAKRVFKPNLNVVRTKTNEVRTSKDTVGRGKGKSERGRPDRAAGSKRNSLVQTQGVFSEGGAIAQVKRVTSARYSSRENSASEGLNRPVISRNEIKFDPEAEKRHIRDIIGDDADNEVPEDDDKLMPISVDDYKRIKQEKEAEREGLQDFIRNQGSSFLLLQLPDSLPGLPFITKMETAQNKDDTKLNVSGDFYTLRDVPEGQIGKLLKFKSGKMRLVLGENHIFDITYAIDQSFLQEVVSINTNKQERSGSIVNLGKVNGKLSVIPDWSQLFIHNS